MSANSAGMRARIAVFVFVALVIAGGIGLGITLRKSSDDQRTERRNIAPAEVLTALDRLATDPESLVASTSKERLGNDAAKGVPPGSTVTPDPATWKSDGVGGGVILIALEVPGAAAEKYLAVMVHEADGWKVAETYPVGASS